MWVAHLIALGSILNAAAFAAVAEAEPRAISSLALSELVPTVMSTQTNLQGSTVISSQDSSKNTWSVGPPTHHTSMYASTGQSDFQSSANSTKPPSSQLQMTGPSTTLMAEPSHVTGGAIPQQMQSSMAGLLGFFIMCLVML